MEVGDRVTVLSGACRLWEGEMVGGESSGRVRVWFPARGVTRSFATDELAPLTSAFQRRPRPSYRRDSERGHQQRIAGR